MIQDERIPEETGITEELLSSTSSLKELRDKEWSIGSGQCPVCRGVNEAWHGHPLYTDPGKIGHSTWCQLATELKEKGETPLYVGTYSSDKKFETYWKTYKDLQGFEHRLLGSRRLNR
jgi:hypothetical protein